MKCPHCLTSFHHEPVETMIGLDRTSRWHLVSQLCPACGKFILRLREEYERFAAGGLQGYREHRDILCYPKTSARAQLAPEVPDEYACDYREACLTLADSPKASAALSRRCLQHLLREEAKVKHGNLAAEIQQAIDNGNLPTMLAESLDAIRNIGNFAAHPTKDTATGEIIDVEEGEAEWNLDVLESLFDYYFVQPAILKRKRDALNAKLRDAGKPEMK